MMNQLYHKKLMERLISIETKVDYAHSIYTKRYIIVNKESMCNFLMGMSIVVVCLTISTLFY